MKEILLLATGITFFLFGMLKLSVDVQKLFTIRIRDYIKYAVKRPVYGLLVGAVSTILFQSSSATSVLVIGMVNAGLITFHQSLGIILGADIGTTLTVQLIVWKFADISPLFIIAGATLWFAGKEKWKVGGELIFFFGMIFFGLSMISYVTAPLKGNAAIIRFFQETKHPLIGIGIGVLVAGVVQASAIPIGILVILAQHNLVTIENALPMVFGANVGTTVTALMASMVTSVSGKRSAISHFIFKGSGVLVAMAILPCFLTALNFFTNSAAQQIALGHLLFNVIIVVLFLFILKPYCRLVEKMLSGQEEILPLWPEFLDAKHLADPQKALECVKKEMHREIALSEKIFTEALALRKDYKEWRRNNIDYMKPVVDHLRMEIMNYLYKISLAKLSPVQSKRLFSYTTMVEDIGRISNHAAMLTALSKGMYHTQTEFSAIGTAELEEIEKLVTENFHDAVALIERRDEKMIGNVSGREETVDRMVKVARESHLIRYYCGICRANAGPFFVEMLLHLERISDLCQNVAEYVDELGDD